MQRDRRIESVRAWAAPAGGGAYFPADGTDGDGHWMATLPMASPLQRYPGYERSAGWVSTLGGVAVEVGCAHGETGIGVAHGGPAAWDLRGKRAELPVFEVIAPGASPRVELYATGPRPDVYERAGFRGAKVSLPYGPAAGDNGFRDNLRCLEGWRRELDGDCFLAVDCFMGLDEPYARRLLEAVRRLGIRWLEEPFLPWELDGLGALRGSGVPLASGEHNDNFQLERLVDERLVDIVQPELTWCGGLTPALRLAAAAAARGVTVIPHCGGVYAQHFVAASADSPFAELLIGGADGTEAVPTFGELVTGEPTPENGAVELRPEPGFAIALAATGLVRP